MSAHLHVSVALVVRATLKQLKKAGIDPYADESTYPDVAVGFAPDINDGPEYYLWAKKSLTFIASSDGDGRNAGGLYSIAKLMSGDAELRLTDVLYNFCVEHKIHYPRAEWVIIRRIG